MVDMPDPKGAKREIEQEAYRYYEQLSGTPLARRPDGSFAAQGHNDQLDAFRHAYTSGRVTQIAGGMQWVARHFGNDAEIGAAHPHDPYEHRMDLWNNAAGRRLGDATADAPDLAQRTYAALRNGELVGGVSDPRLRQLYPQYPRLRLAQGDRQRELVAGGDVDRINSDVSRLQDQAQDRFPPGQQDRACFDALRAQLPDHVSDTKVAHALLAAKSEGIGRVDQIGAATLHNGQIVVSGKTPGFRAQVDANAPRRRRTCARPSIGPTSTTWRALTTSRTARSRRPSRTVRGTGRAVAHAAVRPHRRTPAPRVDGPHR
ncbi:DUF6973 domain-containing protein [Xanthomonas theicola]|uniref:DUF6973 domain-containing protein n=1 Tax=Xanthomonas theicola TaxID=56464 RepID=A0A2S6ZKN6_9XANT|nr:hypothetical protein [Xanthomonas theicola]PPT92739.1 hypothetical protein XthCFBP4691_02720 [Xanthomonas theicola]QNH24340.1 hypothetical protein G4Q83_05665 [Xanthomonas theicola]